MAKKIKRGPGRNASANKPARDEWLVLIFEPDPEPYGEHEVLYFGRGGPNPSVKVAQHFRPLTVDGIAELFLVDDPSEPPPRIVITNDPRIKAVFAQVAPHAAVTVVPTSASAPLIEDMRRDVDLGQLDDPTRAESSRLHVCAYGAEIGAAAARIAAESPWHRTDKNAPIHVEADGEEIPFRVFVLSNMESPSETMPCVLAYANHETWSRLREPNQSSRVRPPADAAVLYQDEASIPDDVVDELYERGFVTDGLCPRVVRLSVGPASVIGTHVADRAEARGLAIGLSAVASFVEQHLENDEPRATPLRATYDTPLGVSVTVTYQGRVTAPPASKTERVAEPKGVVSSAARLGSSGDPSSGDVLTRFTESLLRDVLPFPHALWTTLVGPPFLRVAVAAAGSHAVFEHAHTSGRGRADVGDVPAILVRASKADAEKGAATFARADTLYETETAAGVAFFVGGGGALLGLLPVDENPDIGVEQALLRQRMRDGGSVAFMLFPGGARSKASILAQKAAFVAKLRYQRVPSLAELARILVEGA